MVKTSPSHGEDRSSTLLRVTRAKKLRGGGVSFFSSPPLPQAVDCARLLMRTRRGRDRIPPSRRADASATPLSADGGLAVSFVGNSEVCASPLFVYPVRHTVPRRMLRSRFDFVPRFFYCCRKCARVIVCAQSAARLCAARLSAHPCRRKAIVCIPHTSPPKHRPACFVRA